INNLYLFLYFFAYHLATSGVPPVVRVPPVENHCNNILYFRLHDLKPHPVNIYAALTEFDTWCVQTRFGTVMGFGSYSQGRPVHFPRSLKHFSEIGGM